MGAITTRQWYYVDGKPFTMKQLADKLGVTVDVAKGRVRAAPRPLTWADLRRPGDKATIVKG